MKHHINFTSFPSKDSLKFPLQQQVTFPYLSLHKNVKNIYGITSILEL